MTRVSPQKIPSRAPLERHRLDQFTKGWFVGNFLPTLLPSDAVEVAVKHYRAGDCETAHHHRIATELTVVVSGLVRMSGEDIGAGEIIRIAPGQSTDFTAVTDATTVVVKMPCVSGDKYADSPSG
jgi:mannose-6-phosphate isomerase-like protein (cupin superfamily)